MAQVLEAFLHPTALDTQGDDVAHVFLRHQDIDFYDRLARLGDGVLHGSRAGLSIRSTSPLVVSTS